jgi:hypothetical protein
VGVLRTGWAIDVEWRCDWCWLPACRARPIRDLRKHPEGFGSPAPKPLSSWAGKNPRARGCREVEPDYPPAAKGELHGASTAVTTEGYWPQALAVATRFVICLILLNREKVLGAASDLSC